MTDPFFHFDAAYSMGALDAEDLTAFEAHLRTCAACQARVEQLRPTMGLLAAVRAAGDVGSIPAEGAHPLGSSPPDTLLPDLLRRAGRERARRRWATTGIAGFAAACLVALLIVVWPSSSSTPPRHTLVAVRAGTPVRATAQLVAEAWGTQIDIHCTYDGPTAVHSPYSNVKYALRVFDRDRHSYDLGTWSPVPDRVTSFTAGTAVRRERITRVQVTLADGTPILQLSL